MLCLFFFLRIRRPPRSTRTDTLFPYTTRFRSEGHAVLDLFKAATVRYFVTGQPQNVLQATSAQQENDMYAFVEQGVCRLKKARTEGGESEEHTSELQSLMRISYAVFCLKKKNQHHQNTKTYCSDSHRETK